MATNRLLPYQFAKGLSAAPTRIETALRKLVDLYNDVPPSLVERRWTPTHRVAHSTGTPFQATYKLPWMTSSNLQSQSNRQPPDDIDIKNNQRVKSSGVPGISLGKPANDGELYTWEISFATTKPTILSCVTAIAEYNPYYLNEWKNGIAPAPPTKVPNAPANDFTFQVCVDDAWDMQNRKKLRQEALVYQTSAQTFQNSPNGIAGVWTTSALPVNWGVDSSPSFYCVSADPLVLIPELANVRIQFTYPKYLGYNSSWNTYGPSGNAWTIHLELWEQTR